MAIPLIQFPAIFTIDRMRPFIPGMSKWMEKMGAKAQEEIIRDRMGDRQADYVPKNEGCLFHECFTRCYLDQGNTLSFSLTLQVMPSLKPPTHILHLITSSYEASAKYAQCITLI
ncbi:MAG: hypothetical protein GY751_25960 [Bacteroidetes bacterium]|nr:hypothetical protein [Bacteroidota bacterium]